MPNTYIKDANTWRQVQRPFVKDGGSWKPIKKIWVKTDVTETVVSGGVKTGDVIGSVAGCDSGWFNQSYGSWGQFMNTYAIDTAGSLNSTKTFTAYVNFVEAGDYYFDVQLDNYGTLSLDDVIVNSLPKAAGGNNFVQNLSFNAPPYRILRAGITAGIHKITITMIDYGVIAGLAARIVKDNFTSTQLPDTEIWNTRQAISTPIQYVYTPIVSKTITSSAWKQVFGNTGSRLFNTVGSSTFIVPPGVYSIDVSYPNGSGGITTTTLNVTPKDSIPVTIALQGDANNSVFGSITVPYTNYSQRVIYHYSQVDRYLRETVQIVTSTGDSYSASNVNNNTMQTGAATKGIYLSVDLENSWGDLVETINITPLKSDSSMPAQLTASVVKTRGRGSVYIEEQPSADNGYKVRTLVDDNGPSAADYYEYSVYIDTAPYISISY